MTESVERAAVRSVARSRQARFRHRDPLDGRSAWLALLDRIEAARATQAESGFTMLECRRGLAGHHLGDLARPEIGDLDLSVQHAHLGAAGVHGDAELRALDDGGEIGRLDFEMLDVALFDFEQDRACLLHDGGRKPVLLLRRQADNGVGRYQNRLLATDQQHAAVAPGPNGVAGLQRLFLLERDLLRAVRRDPDVA